MSKANLDPLVEIHVKIAETVAFFGDRKGLDAPLALAANRHLV
ncbi:hypothetical protein [Aquamicrobium defluvii]|jgi:hypothetical protein|nr:hypothetical protein [Aquamicrobium defluvii]